MKTIQLPIYKSGKSVIYNNTNYVIDYVHIKSYNIYVKLHNIDELIESKYIFCEYEIIKLCREEVNV